MRDYVLPNATRWATYAAYNGVDDVRASSALSDAGAGPSSLGRLPWAALDGDPETSWQSTRFSDDDGHWWEVDLADDAVPPTVTVTGALVGEQEVVLSTDDWTSEPVVLAPNVPTRIEADDRESDHLRITDAAGSSSTPLSISEVVLAGITPQRVLELPQLPEGAGAPDAVVLRAIPTSAPAARSWTSTCDASRVAARRPRRREGSRAP